ncbi:MAG: alkaline phosphatase PafA [Balneolaceae bacterium]|nr:alkaline phosphatase PafA [Balneolaceae bacterium]
MFRRSLFLTPLLAFALCLTLAPNPAGAQSEASPAVEEAGPRLVVGIVVDQMRYEYLQRYRELYGEDGFRRLTRQGFSFDNAHFNYFPTYTGPGHASVFTGATPSVHGIVGNAWYDRKLGRSMYVVEDTSVSAVGSVGSVGQMSPRNLRATTLADEIKSADPASNVVAVSIKDRGAVIPAGHVGDAAYWYDSDSGRFISSSWYMDALPDWVENFNEQGLARRFSDSTWTLAMPADRYAAANPDDTPYEGTFDGEERPVFPHAMGGDPARIRTSPFGNTLVRTLAEHAVTEENLGADAVTDFLGVSFSSTDYVGHQFGPRSLELADTYLKLDREMAALFDFLDRQVGEGNYMVFFTSDHGVVDVPAELVDRGLPGGSFDREAALTGLRNHLEETYGEGDWIESYTNQQVYLDRALVAQRGIDLESMQRSAADFLLRYEGVQATNTAYNFLRRSYTGGVQAMFQRGFYHDRSGDVFLQLAPGWLDSGYPTGTSHGSPWNYDTHVPLIFMGPGVPQGATWRKVSISQLAPTVSAMLGISFPSGSEADVLRFN